MDKVKSVTEKTLSVSRGFTYRYFVSNSSSIDKSKPTLLFLHGWPDGARLWQYVVPQLEATGLPVLVPDLLGYGGTSKPSDPKHYNYRLQANDIAEILEAEGLDKVIPVGHDWGAYLSSRVTLLWPERCVASIILNVAYIPPMTDHVDLDAMNKQSEEMYGFPRYIYWKLFSAPDAPKIFEEHIESVYHVMHGADDDWIYQMFCVPDAMRNFLLNDKKANELRPYAKDREIYEGWKQELSTGGFEGPFNWYHAMLQDVHTEEDKKLSPEAAVMKMPVLFIGCDQDQVCQTSLIYLIRDAGLLPDLTVHELHASHWCPLEKPEEIGDYVKKFLKDKDLMK